MDQVFVRYFNATKTDYAVLFTGPWGCGKTHYIRNRVFDLARAAGLTPVYFSLSTLREPAAILRRVILSKILKREEVQADGQTVEALFDAASYLPNGKLVTGALKVAGTAIGRIARAATPLSDIALFLDDIERLPESVDLGELMGTVFSGMIDVQHAKVVIIGDDKRLAGRFEEFATIREKYIRTSVQFQLPRERLIREYVVSRFGQGTEFAKHILENFQILERTFNSVEIANLRTIGFALDCYGEIFSLRAERLVAPLLPRVLLTILLISAEYAQGFVGTSDEEKLKSLNGAVWGYHVWIKDGTKNAGQNTDKPYEVRFVERHGEEPTDSLLVTDSICRLILGKSFSKKSFLAELQHHVTGGKPQWELDLNQLASFSGLERPEIERCFHSVLEAAERGEIGILRYPYFYSIAVFLRDHGYFTDIPDDLLHRLKQGIEATEPSEVEGAETDLGFALQRFDRTRPPTEEFQEIVGAIRSRISGLQEQHNSIMIEKLFMDASVLDDEAFGNQFREAASGIDFSSLAVKSTAKALLGMTNLGIWRLEMIIRSRFTSIANAGSYFMSQVEPLSTLSKLVIEGIKDRADLDETRYARLRDLSESLQSAADHIVQTRPPTQADQGGD